MLKTLERPTTGVEVPEQQGNAQQPDEERTNFSARVRTSVRRRARLYAASQDVSLQDLMDAALDEYLSRRGA